MKKFDLEKSVALLANIGVIAGIVFLALEIRQNTDALQAQTRSSITDNNLLYLGWVATNPQLADIRGRARLEGVDGLSDTETTQLNAFVSAEFRIWENTFYQYERGLFTQPEFEARRNTWIDRLTKDPRSDFYQARWATIGERFSPTFRKEIERILADKGGQD